MNEMVDAVMAHTRRGTPPLPGRGETLARWRTLASITAQNTVVGRLYEAHADAVAILTDLGHQELLASEQLWGVWAAQPPQPVLTARYTGTGWVLEGTKPWCSGASLCTHALVTATVADPPHTTGSVKACGAEGQSAAAQAGDILLFAITLSHTGVSPVPGTWQAVGMADSDSGSVEFATVAATLVGTHQQYVGRPGFWHGGMGVAACWFGGMRAVAEPLLRRTVPSPQTTGGGARGSTSSDGPSRIGSELRRAHAGAVAAQLSYGWALLAATAEAVDADPEDSHGLAQARGLMLRTAIERSAAEVMERVGRALGPGPLCSDADHARRVADLGVYIRQSHAEADEAAVPPAVGPGQKRATASWDQLIGVDLTQPSPSSAIGPSSPTGTQQAPSYRSVENRG